ncbi:MAG: IclR family transcriptional regulator [Chloroflexota bacterium]
MTNTNSNRPNSIQSIERAIAILRSFSEQEPGLGVNELGRRLGLHKSTVSRILSTLQQEGLVWQDEDTGKYRLGIGLVSLAGVALGQIDARKVAQNHLDTLVTLSQETANVSVLDGTECVTVDRAPSPQPLRYVGWIGRRLPLYCTASGKALLAGLSEEERLAHLPASLTKYTENTITDKAVLFDHLNEAKRQGYATVQEEFEAGFSAIAAPVFGPNGTISAAVSISGPSYRMNSTQIAALVGPLCQAVNVASRELGYLG